VSEEDAVICVRQLIAEPRPAAGSSLHNLGPAQQRKRGRNNACAHSSLTLLPRLAAPQEERRDLAGAGLQFVRVSPRSALVDADTRQTIGSILLANAVEVDEGARALDQPPHAVLLQSLGGRAVGGPADVGTMEDDEAPGAGEPGHFIHDVLAAVRRVPEHAVAGLQVEGARRVGPWRLQQRVRLERFVGADGFFRVQDLGFGVVWDGLGFQGYGGGFRV